MTREEAAVAFAERLAERDVLTMPGQVAELPGYFRLSLTASDDMVERALPALEAATRPPPGGSRIPPASSR